MKSPTLNLALLFAALAVAATVWRLMPEPAVHDIHELVDTHSQPEANQARSESPTFFTVPDAQGSPKPEVTKSRGRPRTEQSTREETRETSAKPSATSSQKVITERVRASVKDSLVGSPLPTPAAFIALDPSVSGIPPTHEPMIQAMAEQAAEILKDYELDYKVIEESTELSDAEKKSAWSSLRENASNGIQSIDHAFLAKYGTRAWIAHHIAAHREFAPQE